MELKIKTQIKIAKPVNKVFDAIIDNKKMKKYFITSGSAKMEAGKTVIWEWKDYYAKIDINIVKIVKNKFISFKWKGNLNETTVNMTFETVNKSSTIIKVQEDGWNNDKKGLLAFAENTQGWVAFCYCLKAWLEFGISLNIGVV
jgi:uncharacterized protein YndB with AHSA1/START domain